MKFQSFQLNILLLYKSVTITSLHLNIIAVCIALPNERVGDVDSCRVSAPPDLNHFPIENNIAVGLGHHSRSHTDPFLLGDPGRIGQVNGWGLMMALTP